MAESDVQVDQPAAAEEPPKEPVAKAEANGHTNGHADPSPPVAKPEVNGDSPEEAVKVECPVANGPPEQNGTPTASPCHTAGPQPGVDTAGWVKGLKEKNLGKIAHLVIEWVYKTTKTDESKVPGAKRQSTTREEFIGAAKDGILLAQLANSLKGGSVASVSEDPADKEKLKANVDGFLHFVKTEAELPDDKLFDSQELVDGSVQFDFNSLLVCLVELSLMAQSKWSVEGLSVEQLQKAVRKGSIKEKLTKPFKKFGDSIGAVFRRNNSTSGGSPEKKRPDKQAATEEPVANGTNGTPAHNESVPVPTTGVQVETAGIPDIDVTTATEATAAQ